MTDTIASLRSRIRRLWPLGLGLVLSVPFLNKPFHIDDPDYLRIARQIRADPFDPYGLELVRGGHWYPAGAVHPSPPLFCYLLAAATTVFGEREVPLHILSSVFVVWGVVIAARLGGHFNVSPAAAATLIMASPMVLPGQNVMLDVPMMVLAMAAVERQLRVTLDQQQNMPPGERPNGINPTLSGLLLSAACLTKYPALVLVVPMALHWHLSYRRIPLGWCLGMGLPVAVWWIFYTIRYEPFSAAGHAIGWPTWHQLVTNVPSTLIIIGATCMALPLAVRRPGRESGGWAFLVGLVIGTVAALLEPLWPAEQAPPQTLELILRAVFGGAGGAMVGTTIAICIQYLRDLLQKHHTQNSGAPTEAFDNHPDAASLRSSKTSPRAWELALQNQLLLVLWWMAGVGFSVAVRHTTVRHAMLALAPMVLLLLMKDHFRKPGARNRASTAGVEFRRRRYLACGMSLALALGLAHADWRYAHATRELIEQLRDMVPVGGQAYVAGDWGMGYYAEQLGLEPIHERTRFRVPALLAIPLHTQYADPSGRLSGLRLLRGRALAVPGGWNPLRTVARGVNYYHVGPRNLPWSIQRDPWEALALYHLSDPQENPE